MNLGYESENLVENMGTMYVALLCYLFMVLIYLLVASITYCLRYKWLEVVRNAIYDTLFWNLLLVLTAEGYIEIVLCCMKNIKLKRSLDWAELTVHDKFSLGIAYFLAIFSTVVPSAFYCWIISNY